MPNALSIFPSGAPGVAILLLRASAVALLALYAPHLCAGRLWGAAPLAITAICLTLGLVTRVLAGVCAVVLVVLAWRAGAGAGEELALHALPVAALALFGGGAYSVDAHLFGRRVIHLPR